jgi:hypothetical protein
MPTKCGKFIHTNNIYIFICYIVVILLVGYGMITVIFHYFPPIPDTTNIKVWSNYTKEIAGNTLGYNNSRIVFFLIFLHVLHFIFCMPFLYVTKIFYGFLLGPMIGFSLAIMVEGILLTGSVYVLTKIYKFENNNFKDMLGSINQYHSTNTIVVLSQISSFPLHCSVTLVTNDFVTIHRFLLIHIFVSVVMTAKDVGTGYLLEIRNSSPYIPAIFTAILVLSGVIPFIVAMYLTWCNTIFKYIEHKKLSNTKKEKGEVENSPLIEKQTKKIHLDTYEDNQEVQDQEAFEVSVSETKSCIDSAKPEHIQNKLETIPVSKEDINPESQIQYTQKNKSTHVYKK